MYHSLESLAERSEAYELSEPKSPPPSPAGNGALLEALPEAKRLGD